MKKVVLGFKCSQDLKEALAKEAIEHDMTLSQYVNTIVADSMSVVKENENLIEECHTLRGKLKQMRSQLMSLENDSVKKLYEKFRFTEVEFTQGDGKKIKKMINTPFNIIEVMVNSYKS